MTQIPGDIEILLPREQDLASLLEPCARVPFDPAILTFIEALGRKLRSDPASRAFPELVALGFWARPASIQRLKQRFEASFAGYFRLPRGLAFHIAPSNVDSIFVYSLLLSMLAGNRNLVRISSRAGAQSSHLLQLLSQALAEADSPIQKSVAIIRTSHGKDTMDWLSAQAGLRIIWGGDQTVTQIRQSPLTPGGREIVFPNRTSLAVVDAAQWLKTTDKPMIAKAFVNDSLWFGQMACSSPRDLVWRGTSDVVAQAAPDFWAHLDQAARASNLDWVDASAVAKLLAAQDLAVDGGLRQRPLSSNWLTIVCPSGLHGLGTPSPTGGGFFREYRIANLADLAPHVQRNWQTIVSHGIAAADWHAFLQENAPAGIDRIVKPGEALNFDAIWDGMDLLTEMTRLVAVQI